VEPAGEPAAWDGGPLFGGQYTVAPGDWPPVLVAAADDPILLAHALAASFEDHAAVANVEGVAEPLVGRETHPQDGRFGVWLSQARVCYPPGSRVGAHTRFRIGPYGIWERGPDGGEGAA
jgi:hypothetical protein